MTDPLKLIDLMPALARRVADDVEHQAHCSDRSCQRCGREQRPATAPEHHREALIANALRRIPPAYAAAELGAPWLVELVGAATLARAQAAMHATHLAFLGPPGAGKSSLAAAMLRRYVRTVPSKDAAAIRWVSSHGLAKARAGQPLGTGEAPLVEMCMSASLLVLDELGGEDPRYASAVGEVLFDRHEQARPTWVTTGVGSREIATRYGGGIARRVFEGAEVFRLGGQP